MLKKFLLLLILSSFSFFTFSKDLPKGYKNIQLGMNLEETKEELLKDMDFGYHGDRDVSLLPNQNKVLIQTDSEYGHGSNFLTNCYFQFSDDYLYIITINFNQDKIDYYSIFQTLTQKYGEPKAISPQSATWKDQNVTLTLEKPLALKYVDNEVFDSLQNYSTIQKSATEITKQMFLDEL